jgi:DNA processing protein
MTGAPEDDDRSTAAHAAALAGLDRMTPVRLAKILDGFSPATAWAALCAGTHPADTRRLFTRTARATDVTEVGERYARAGVAVLTPGGQRYPSALVGDPGAPAVLFAVGDPAVLEGRRRVAIVGTRSATPYGCRVASELAADLAAEDVVVVSGLALGIDGAAHAGVVCRRTDAGRVTDARPATDAVAPPVAVVGTGLDRRRGGRRVSPERGVDVHRRCRRSSVHPRLCRTRFGAQPCFRWNQCVTGGRLHPRP